MSVAVPLLSLTCRQTYDMALQQWHQAFCGAAQALFWVFFKAQYMLADL